MTYPNFDAFPKLKLLKLRKVYHDDGFSRNFSAEITHQESIRKIENLELVMDFKAYGDYVDDHTVLMPLTIFQYCV